MAAQLPARQHGLHPWYGCIGGVQGGIEEAEGQQHPRPRQGWGGGRSAQAAEGGGGEALGQLEAPEAAELQAVAAPGGGDAEPGRPVPEELEAVARWLRQQWQARQGVDRRQRHGQAEHPIGLELGGHGPGFRQQLLEWRRGLHQRAGREALGKLLKCMGPAAAGGAGAHDSA